MTIIRCYVCSVGTGLGTEPDVIKQLGPLSLSSSAHFLSAHVMKIGLDRARCLGFNSDVT